MRMTAAQERLSKEAGGRIRKAGGERKRWGGKRVGRRGKRKEWMDREGGRRVAELEAMMPVLVGEFPELSLYQSHVNYLPTGKRWGAKEIAGMHFLMEQHGEGKQVSRAVREAWSVEHGCKGDYLDRLTRRGGFEQAFRRMRLVKVLLEGPELDSKILMMAKRSEDPRWMAHAMELRKEAEEGLGLVERGRNGALEQIGALTVQAALTAHLQKVMPEIRATVEVHKEIEGAEWADAES